MAGSQVEIQEELRLRIPEGLPADVAVAELAAAATNMGRHCPGIYIATGIVAGIAVSRNNMTLFVDNKQAGSTRLLDLLLAVAPLTHLCRRFHLRGPVTEDEDDEDDNEEEVDADVEVVNGIGLPMLFGVPHMTGLAQALSDIKELTLSRCTVLPGVLHALCDTLTSLTSLSLLQPVWGAVASSDLAVCCIRAPRPITISIDIDHDFMYDHGSTDDKRAEVEAARADRTLSYCPGVLGRVTYFVFP